ncbi:hypothetical protein GCM10023212_08250 [Luteolibacter yonseiensis]
MRISIQPSALADLRSGFHFYESRESGLGDCFLETLYSEIDSLQLYGGIHAIHFGSFHRLLSKRFPYGIYYSVSADSIFVNAVLDLRRNPEWITRTLDDLA